MSHDEQLATPQGRRLLTALRKVCVSFPNVVEHVDGFGHTTFRVGTKSFVIAGMGEHGTAISFKSNRVNQELLVGRGPYYRTPYIGQHGWVSVDRPLEQNWEEIKRLIVDAYRLATPKRLGRQRAKPRPSERPGADRRR